MSAASLIPPFPAMMREWRSTLPHMGDCVMQTKDRSTSPSSAPWNKGKIVGQKRPFKLQEVWAIRIRLQLASRTRDLALFDLAIDSKLRGCDLVALRVSDVAHGQSLLYRAIVLQRKTQRPVQFEITEPPERRSRPRSQRQVCDKTITSSPAGSTTLRTCRPDSMRGSSIGGCDPSIWILPSTAPTPCAAPRRR